MEKEFIPYGLAVKLKALGFDEPCVAIFGRNNELNVDDGFYKQENYHKDTVLAPTFSQAFRWFRKLNLIGHVRESWSFDNKLEYVSQINGTFVNHGFFDKPVNRFETYEEAELACLDKLIEIVESKSE